LILTWASDAQLEEPQPSASVVGDGLDVLQADAAAAVAGQNRLVLVVGPAGTGKTTMLHAAVHDLDAKGRPVFGVAPTAKAAHVLAAQTGMHADTIAKLLCEWTRSDRPPDPAYRLPGGTTLIVDEAGMVGTPALHQLTCLADQRHWRLVLVGDPRQLQAVGRGGMFTELCAAGRTHELVRIHRFMQPWEADASLQLRQGDPNALDHYEEHGRIQPGTLDDHLAAITHEWLAHTAAGRTVAITASSNQHVDSLNDTIQHARLAAGQLDPASGVPIAGGEHAHAGEIVVTRRNDRQLGTDRGETVHNRDTWTVTAINTDGALTVIGTDRGTVTLPAGYVAEHIRLGYAATEHGHQGDTVDIDIALTSTATTHRGLYVAVTRGRHDNRIHVITDTEDPAEAREVLEAVLSHDRADLPAVAQRRHLAEVAPTTRQRATIPDWVEPWRQRLEQQREQLDDRLAETQQRRQAAARELVERQPALDAAQAEWRPYQQRIDMIQTRLDDELRPRLWAANAAARDAGLGRRRAKAHHVRDAREAVDSAEREIAAIRADGAPARERSNALEARARRLTTASTGEDIASLHDLERRELVQLETVIDALDTYTAWLDGRRTPKEHLADAVETLSAVARQAPPIALGRGEVSQGEWYALLELAPSDLTYRLTPPRPALNLGR
jgi:hypothetical protein